MTSIWRRQVPRRPAAPTRVKRAGDGHGRDARLLGYVLLGRTQLIENRIRVSPVVMCPRGLPVVHSGEFDDPGSAAEPVE